MTLDQVKRILYDIALTIEVHPLALGVLTEDNGKFHLPAGVTISATIISSVIAWHKTNESRKYRADQAESKVFSHADNIKNIPQLVEKLQVSDEMSLLGLSLLFYIILLLMTKADIRKPAIKLGQSMLHFRRAKGKHSRFRSHFSEGDLLCLSYVLDIKPKARDNELIVRGPVAP